MKDCQVVSKLRLQQLIPLILKDMISSNINSPSIEQRLMSLKEESKDLFQVDHLSQWLNSSMLSKMMLNGRICNQRTVFSLISSCQVTSRMRNIREKSISNHYCFGD